MWEGRGNRFKRLLVAGEKLAPASQAQSTTDMGIYSICMGSPLSARLERINCLQISLRPFFVEVATLREVSQRKQKRRSEKRPHWLP